MLFLMLLLGALIAGIIYVCCKFLKWVSKLMWGTSYTQLKNDLKQNGLNDFDTQIMLQFYYIPEHKRFTDKIILWNNNG